MLLDFQRNILLLASVSTFWHTWRADKHSHKRTGWTQTQRAAHSWAWEHLNMQRSMGLLNLSSLSRAKKAAFWLPHHVQLSAAFSPPSFHHPSHLWNQIMLEMNKKMGCKCLLIGYGPIIVALWQTLPGFPLFPSSDLLLIILLISPALSSIFFLSDYYLILYNFF